MKIILSSDRTVLICVLIIISILTVWDRADCAEPCYYSIHLASFKELKNANGFVNSLTKKGNMVFWKKSDVPGKGEFYRVYLGKYQNRQDAVKFWNILKEEGAVSYFGIYKFMETDDIPAEPDEFPALAIPKEKGILSPEAVPEIKKERFVDNHDGTITDRATNLMWIKNGWRIDFFSALKYPEAVNKVQEFRHGGYTDWRLPTIEEWQGLMDKNKQYPALTEPNFFENIIVHSPYWSKTAYGPGRLTPAKNPVRAYIVMLYYGRISHQNINKRAFVLPVRSLR